MMIKWAKDALRRTELPEYAGLSHKKGEKSGLPDDCHIVSIEACAGSGLTLRGAPAQRFHLFSGLTQMKMRLQTHVPTVIPILSSSDSEKKRYRGSVFIGDKPIKMRHEIAKDMSDEFIKELYAKPNKAKPNYDLVREFC